MANINFAAREDLIQSLERVMQLEAFSALSDLLQGEALVLQYLNTHQEDAVFPSMLSDRLHLSRSRITGALNSLRRKGLIRSIPSAEDRRRMQIFITDAGTVRIEEQFRQMLAYFDRMIAGLGEADTRLLIALIDRCVQVMER